MNNLLPCPFGPVEHYPRVEMDKLKKGFPDGDKWVAIAICDEHDDMRIHGFGRTQEEALINLEQRWNDRFIPASEKEN